MDINELINRYFAGETTCREEDEIRRFFRQTNIPEDLEVYRPIFAYIDGEIREGKQKTTASSRYSFFKVWGYRAANLAAVFFTCWALHEITTLPQAASENYVVVNGRYSTDQQLIEQKTLEALDNIGFCEDELHDLIVLDI